MTTCDGMLKQKGFCFVLLWKRALSHEHYSQKIKLVKTLVMNLEGQKAIIIEQVKLVNDADLINAIKSILDYAKKSEQKVFDIPEAQQNMVMERFEKAKKNPDRLLDWKEAKNKLNSR